MENDNSVIENWYGQYHGRLVNMGTKMFGGDRHKAEDAAQDVWAELLSEQSNGGLKYDPTKSGVFTHLAVRLRSRGVDRYRRERKEECWVDGARTARGDLLHGVESLPAVNGDPVHLAERRELWSYVFSGLLALPLSYCLAIYLCDIKGLPLYKAARVAGLKSPSGMRARLHKAKKQFNTGFHRIL